MKKIIITLFSSLILVISFHFLTNVIFNGIANPKIIEIDKNIIELPENMHLERFFLVGFTQESKDTVDLILAEEPYHIIYPDKDMLTIIFSNKDDHGTIVLLPSLDKNNFETFVETKAIFKNNCMKAINDNKIYLLNLITNKGYIIMSHNNVVITSLEEQICR